MTTTEKAFEFVRLTNAKKDWRVSPPKPSLLPDLWFLNQLPLGSFVFVLVPDTTDVLPYHISKYFSRSPGELNY